MDQIRYIKPPKNKMALFKSLCCGKLILNSLWKKPSFRYKFALRSIFLSPKTFCWLEHLANYPLMGYYLSQQSNLPCKLLRPYLASGMDNQFRLQALIYHYDFLAKHNDKMTHAFYDTKPFLLAEISGKNEAKITLSIQARNKYAREGELTLFLYDENQINLATLTFSILEYQQKSTLFIAGLQGSDHDDAKVAIQQATKTCYGTFPKRLIVEAALSFAEYYQLQQIVAVGNKTHVYNNWRYKKRLNRVHSDYDNFWATIDGQENSQGIFILPNKISRKTIEEIASKKRSEYRHRYALLDDMNNRIFTQLASLE